MVLVADYAFYASSIEALVDPVAIGEEFTQYHWFLTAYALEGSRASFVNKKSKVDLSTIRLLLEILSICKRWCLLIRRVLRRCLVLEISHDHYSWTVAYCNE